MKNILFKTMLLTLFCINADVYAQSHKKGQVNLNLGIGVGNTLVGNGYTKITPPISMSGEYGITDDISFGGYLGFTSSTYQYSGWDNCYNNGYGIGNSYSYIDTYKWTYTVVGLRGAYHFGRFIKVDKLDVYAGLMLGYDFAHYKYSTTSACPDHIRYSSPTYGGFVPSIYGGARYRFTDNFGLFGEFGYGISFFNLGITLKF